MSQTNRTVVNWTIAMKTGPKTFGASVPMLVVEEDGKEVSYTIARINTYSMTVLVKEGLTFVLGAGGNINDLMSFECRMPLGLVPEDEFTARYNKARWDLIKYLVEHEKSDAEIVRVMRLSSSDGLAEAQVLRQRLKANQRKARKPKTV